MVWACRMQYALEIWWLYKICKSVNMNKKRHHFEILSVAGSNNIKIYLKNTLDSS